MNEERVADSIRRYLDLCAQRIEPVVAERLRRARTEALAHYGEGRSVLRLAAAGHGTGSPGQGAHAWGTRRWVPLLLALAVAIGVTYWHYSEQGPEPGEIDALLLADDLPVGAYLDHRFDAWLKRAQQ